MEIEGIADIANQGIKVPLYDPLGEDSGQWIQVVGKDSDIYRSGRTELSRLAFDNSELEKEEAEAIFDETVIKVLAECIIDWSFDEEATLDERASLLRDAPNIRDKIEDVINSRQMFAKKKLKS